MRARCLVVLLALIAVASGCGGDSKMEVLGADAEIDGSAGSVAVNLTVDPATDQPSTTESSGFTTIKVSDPSSGQVTQWMKTILPLIVEEGSGLAPETCDDGGWIPGVIVLPAWVRDGEFDASCTVSGSTALFVNMVGSTCYVDEEWPEETLTEDCVDAMTGDFEGEAPAYEPILTINGVEMAKPAIVATEVFMATPPAYWEIGGEQPIVFAGYNALLELPAGRYTIVTGYRSVEDDSANTTVTLNLTVLG